ncbi:putative selenium-dependent hydroxylase accessory protein YqeC [Halovenus sp. WSH3]|uniref:Putative selenium-dependent hydroxylase accessory protein YqeC n=1 Tax=Halovenus carboxidivorans TaxID=2692199 RepID=A0A6B0TCA6_9EURY|nr:selenium cofactor biosynthesis protein YqeC [Halovenus carboxidivorans]MXR52540.1 putative selenium-dependent hydroxylase accessory protein YqeC [Halovenus carboxidivorans]
MDLLDAVDARSGVVCVVGAGGKKTMLYTLAGRAADEGLRSVVTATVRIPIFDEQVSGVVATDDPVEALRDADSYPVGAVAGRDGETRYRGYDTAVVDDLGRAGVADVVLAKADGARTREFKAPGDQEPQIPETTETVLPIASVHAVGEPLGEDVVHRPERVASITGLSPGEEITTSDVGAVLASPAGGLKHVPDGATTVPVLNKVDDDGLAEVGREIARDVLDRADVPRVVLTSLLADDPVVDVIE